MLHMGQISYMSSSSKYSYKWVNHASRTSKIQRTLKTGLGALSIELGKLKNPSYGDLGISAG